MLFATITWVHVNFMSILFHLALLLITGIHWLQARKSSWVEKFTCSLIIAFPVNQLLFQIQPNHFQTPLFLFTFVLLRVRKSPGWIPLAALIHMRNFPSMEAKSKLLLSSVTHTSLNGMRNFTLLSTIHKATFSRFYYAIKMSPATMISLPMTWRSATFHTSL